MSSFYLDLISYDAPKGTDPLKPFRANLGQAENLFAESEEKHGEASILAVATFATLITKGFKIGSVTFDVNMAVSMARKLFDRLPRFNGTTELPTMTDAMYNSWAKAIPPFFYPYSCNGRTLVPHIKRKKAAAQFEGMPVPEGMTKDEYTDHILNVLDATGQARSRCKQAFETACLLVARDPNNERLPEFNRETGLLVLENDLMPMMKLENNSVVTYSPYNGADSTIRIPAVAKRQQIALGVPKHETEKLKPKDFRATLNQLRRAAVIPADHEAETSKLIIARDSLKEFLTPSRSPKLTADETAYVTEMRTLIAAHDDRLAKADAMTKENRDKAALKVVQNKKVKADTAREPGPGYAHKDKDGNAINDAALKAS